MREIKIDFDNPGLPQRLDVVENDAQSRFFKAVLYKDGKAYTAPSGATYSIMYRGFGPQNEGWYDTINDGAGKRAACSVSGNVVTCEIARQALRVPGHVSVVLCVTGSNGYMLHGWPIDCNCRNDSYTNGTSVESFFYITQVTNADWTSAIQTWEELKNMIDPTLSVSGKAADAAKVGEAVADEINRAKEAENGLTKLLSIQDTSIKSTLVSNYYISGKKLTKDGLFEDDDTYAIMRYDVQGLDVIRFDWLKKDGIGTAQFQNNGNQPGSGSNENLLGSNFDIIEGKLVPVPATAAYLFVSTLKADGLSYYVNEVGGASAQNVVRSGYIVYDGGKVNDKTTLHMILSDLTTGDTLTVKSNGLTHRLLIWKDTPFGSNLYDTGDFTKTDVAVKITQKAVAVVNFRTVDGSEISPENYTSDVTVESKQTVNVKELLASGQKCREPFSSAGAENIVDMLGFTKREWSTNYDSGVGMLEYHEKENAVSYATDPLNFADEVVTLYIQPEHGYAFYIDEFVKRANGYERNYLYPRFQTETEFKSRYDSGRYFNLYPERYYVISVETADGKPIGDMKITDYISVYKIDNKVHIPHYYKTYLNACIDKVNSRTNGKSGYSFAFVTDIHCRHNTLHSPGILRAAVNECAISTILGGGDWNTAYNYTDMGIRALTSDFKTLREYFDGLPMIKTIGNHEWAYGGFENPYNVTEQWAYDWYFRDDERNKNKPIVYGENGTYFYQDDTTNKVRYVSVNVMDYPSEHAPKENNKIYKFLVGAAQIKWLKEKAFYLPDNDWQLVVFSHVPIWTGTDCPAWSTREVDNAEELEQLVDDFYMKQGYAKNYSGTMLCWIAGHEHRDAMQRIHDGVMLVVSNADCFLQLDGAPERIKGTTSEQCFDIFSINRAEKKVYITRVGAGEDREFAYTETTASESMKKE